MQKFVVATLQIEGLHYWPECPLESVKFLRDKHRHMFHIKAVKSVMHNDRDIEIIMLKREIYSTLNNFKGDFGRLSCEDIAEMLIGKHDLWSCEVLEDGENGAYLCQ